MSLEEGLDPLAEGQMELGGLRFRQDERGDKGLDEIPEVGGDTVEAAGDGDSIGDQRYEAGDIELNIKITPDDGSGPVQPDDHVAFGEFLNELRKVMALLPDRQQPRLLRWRRTGEVAKRLWVLPAHGKPLLVPGDQKRQAFANAVAVARLTAPQPIITSDELHEHTFEAGETFEVVNAGSQTMVQPTAWSLSAPGPVTIEHLDYPAEYLRFPAGPLTVSPDYDIVAPGSFGIVYGRASSWHPTWIVLRPGPNQIKASAPCTLYWRDSF